MVPKVAKAVQIPTLSFDGRVVKENDHVFVSAPWGGREGEPYMIARVMEFLPSTSIPSSNSYANPEGSTTGPRARVAYYLRPRDISNRYISDFRLIVATMHADIIPVTYIRGICTVKHRDEIKELDNYKREKDTFYFHSLYDRYLHRYFDAVPSHRIQNAPPNVVSHLVNNFEYILCEPALSNELCDAQRGCSVCSKWAASNESVTCAMCKCVFHLYCLDPPLTQRPKTGYSWSCAPCSKAHEDEVEAYMETGISPVKKISDTVALPGNSRVKGKGRASESKGSGITANGKDEGSRPPGDGLRTTNGWPMRYFGMHTDALAVLDPHDSLYPRASTRLGNKFQVVVPVWDSKKKEQDSPVEATKKLSSSTKRSRNGTPTPTAEKVESEKDQMEKKRKAKLPERGEDEAAQIIYRPNEIILGSQLEKLLKDIKALPVYKIAGVDLIDKVLSLVGTDSISGAILAARSITQTQLGHAIWTAEEIKQLAEGAAHHNNDLEEIADEIETKSIADIVKRYYMVLGHARQEDVQPETLEERERTVVISRSGRRASGVNYAEDWFENDESSEDEGSIVGPAATVTEKRNRICAVCSTKQSVEWYHCPESFGETAKAGKDHLMCTECGIRWRHYGASYPPLVEEIKLSRSHRKVEVEVKKDEKKEEKKELPKDKGKEKQVAAPSRPTPAQVRPAGSKPIHPPKPCVLCKRMDLKPQLSQCYNCGLSAHAPCYGIPEDPPVDWLCDLCDIVVNKKPMPSNLECILCPPPKDSSSDESLTALECLKPTEGNHFGHLICGIFHPELKFSEPSTLKVIEGISLIPTKRRHQTCHICKKTDIGACIKCDDCLKHFHVACAWTAGYKFAFEMKPLRKKRTKEIVAAKFKEEDGSMTPCVWCPEHHFSQIDRATYDLGQRDPKTRLTALQTYVRADKAARYTDSFTLLRQARTLENLLSPVLAPPTSAPTITSLDNISENSVSVSPPPVSAPIRKLVQAVAPPVPRTLVVKPIADPRSRSTASVPQPSNNSRRNPNPKGNKRTIRPVAVAAVPEVSSSASRTAMSSAPHTLLPPLEASTPLLSNHLSQSQGYVQKSTDQGSSTSTHLTIRKSALDSRPVPQSVSRQPVAQPVALFPSVLFKQKNPQRSSQPSQPSQANLHLESTSQYVAQPARLNLHYEAARSIPQFAAQPSLSKSQPVSQLSRSNTQPLPQPSHQPLHQTSRIVPPSRQYVRDIEQPRAESLSRSVPVSSTPNIPGVMKPARMKYRLPPPPLSQSVQPLRVVPLAQSVPPSRTVQSPPSRLSLLLNPSLPTREPSWTSTNTSNGSSNEFNQSSQDIYASSRQSNYQITSALPRYRSPPPATSLPLLSSSSEKYRSAPEVKSNPTLSTQANYSILPPIPSPSTSTYLPINQSPFNGVEKHLIFHSEAALPKRKPENSNLFDESLHDTSPKRIKLSSASFLPSSSLPQLSSDHISNPLPRLAATDKTLSTPVDQNSPKLVSNGSSSSRPTSSSGRPLPAGFALDPLLEFA